LSRKKKKKITKKMRGLCLQNGDKILGAFAKTFFAVAREEG